MLRYALHDNETRWKRSGFRPLFHRIQELIHHAEQLFHIAEPQFAHVADAEGLPFEGAVAIGDAHAALAEKSVQLTHIDATGIINGSNRLGAITFGGVKLQP